MSLTSINSSAYHLPEKPQETDTQLTRAFQTFKQTSKNDSVRTGMCATIEAAKALHQALLSSDPHEISAGLGKAAQPSRIRAISKKLLNLVREEDSKFKTFVNTMDLATGILSGIKSLDFFKVIHLSKFSAALGKIPVIGVHVAKVLPFTNILAIIDVVRGSLAIGQSVREIRRERANRKKYEAKKLKWENLKSSGNLQSIVAKKITSNKEKGAKAKTQLDLVQSHLQASFETFKEDSDAYEALRGQLEKSSGREKVALKMKISKAFGRANRAKNAYERLCKDYVAEKAKYSKYEVRGHDWEAFATKIQTVNKPHESQVKLAELKVAKWDQKILNSNQLKRDAKIGIAINVASIIVSIASFALTILLLSALPYIAIPLAVAAAVVVAIGVGFLIWKKVRRKISYKPVPVAMIWERQGAVPQQAPA